MDGKIMGWSSVNGAKDGEWGPVFCPAEAKHHLSRVWRSTPSERFTYVSAKFRAEGGGREG